MASPTRLPSLRRVGASSRPVSMIEVGPLANVPNLAPTSTDPELKKAKRRSLLPQFSRKTASEEKDAASSKEDSVSGDGDSSGPSDEHKNSTDSVAVRDMEGDRKAMPPPTSKPSRPMSMIPPRGSSQRTTSSKLPGTRSHTHSLSKERVAPVDSRSARAQSLAALTGSSSSTTEPAKAAAPESSLKRTGSIKAPQQPRADGPVIPSRTTSARTKEGEKSPPSKTKRTHPRSETAAVNEEDTVSSKLRLPASSNLSMSTTPHEASTVVKSESHVYRAALPTSPPRSSITSRPRPTSQIVLPSSKPAFNTFQQHYSPAKSSLPKPPVPSAKHAPKSSLAIELEEAPTLETTKQQIELLQLSLLHQSSIKSTNDYTASAKRKLGKKHSKLRREYEGLRAMELVHQRACNLSALDAWCPDPGLLVENLQILSLVYTDLTSLMEEGSRHSDVASMFELWVNEAENAAPGTFIQPLPEDWRTSHASLALKLRTIQRNLRVLPPVLAAGEAQASGVKVVLGACKGLAEDLLGELEVMVKLEREVMVREKGRVESEVDDMMNAANNESTSGRWIPAWQTVQ